MIDDEKEEGFEYEDALELYECPSCEGTGKGHGPKDTCLRCKGTKVINENQ